jgi:hypothetical protein
LPAAPSATFLRADTQNLKTCVRSLKVMEASAGEKKIRKKKKEKTKKQKIKKKKKNGEKAKNK